MTEAEELVFLRKEVERLTELVNTMMKSLGYQESTIASLVDQVIVGKKESK